MSDTSTKILHYSKTIVAALTFVATLLTTIVGVAAFAIPAAYIGVVTSVIAAIGVVGVFITTNAPKVAAIVDDFEHDVVPVAKELTE